MPLASRDALLGLNQRRFTTVEIPEHGLSFRIQSLTEAEKSHYETQTLTKKGDVSRAKINDARRRLVCLCLVDEVGNRLFADGEQDLLKPIDGLATSRIYDACRDHCGFAEGDIEDMVGNSAAISGSVSPTD